ncbi:MAG TPA: NADH-ubiquinone oxidoreductase-F iron-sulfur binding region domain-containing protein [Candidatus Woesearchaeota archaeon]|nr:NADH-ubiquinone oxidoreductase-F iron-sulfur binding region domain-containing protein [Candidatus Woesearchaeota archaeon]
MKNPKNKNQKKKTTKLKTLTSDPVTNNTTPNNNNANNTNPNNPNNNPITNTLVTDTLAIKNTTKKIKRTKSPHIKKSHIKKPSSKENTSKKNITKKHTISEYTICVCGATGCKSRDSLDIISAIKKTIIENKSLLNSKKISIQIKQTGCHGFCQVGPTAIIQPQNIFYCHLKPSDASSIIASIIDNKILSEKTFSDEKKSYPYFADIPFFKHQNRVILKDCGFINPLNLEEYIHLGGFIGLKNAVFEGSEKTLLNLEKSKLRGRGGAGFPTAKKWRLLKDAKLPSNNDLNNTPDNTSKTNPNKIDNNRIIPLKYIVCNADEGDPGAFMDRGILESNPYLLLEGMLICAFVTGAKKGFIYLRKEYPLAESTLKKAIQTMYERGFLGENVLNLGFDFDLQLMSGAGAFVCGEETALIHSIEGNRGNPRPRPPYPASQGIYSMPTNINNVKTYCCVTLILKNGAEWFSELGDENSGGTLVLALSGNIKNTGLIEVNFGEKLSVIIEKIGGGSLNGSHIKAIQTGGPSGGCIPYSLKNLKIGYESLKEAGSIVGSGGMIVLDETNSILELAHYFLDFTSKESCGQCTPCREGTRQMKYMLERIISKDGSIQDIQKIEKLAHYVKENSLCGLGQTAPNPILSSLKYFKDEYLSKVAKSKITYKIIDSCIGCHNCYSVCPVNAIYGQTGKKHIILQDKCIHCGKCVQSCPINSIIKVDMTGKEVN